MTDQNDDRWALPGIEEALQWLDFRNQQGISVALDALGEYAKDTEQAAENLSCFKKLLATGRPFDVGTHDPVLIEQMKPVITDRSQVCFGFLKGLADQTKQNLAQSGFGVSEYVPYGTNRKAYVARRHLYLKNLEKAGLTPAP